MDYQPPPFFSRGPAPLVRLGFFVSLAVLLMVLDARFRYAESLREAVALLVYPFQRTALAPVELLSAASEFFTTQAALMRENDELKAKRLLAANDLLTLEALRAENAQLRRLLEARERLPRKSTLAEILYQGRDPFSRKVVLDKGSRQGIRAGQAVIDDIGVIGQVTRAHLLLSEVTLITDKEQRTPVQVVRNGLRAIIYGGGDRGTLDLSYTAANADIQADDVLVTSGIDGTYPAGLPVAKVSRIERDAAYSFAKITCVLALLFNLLPWRDVIGLPDMLALVLTFWCVHEPRRMGIGAAWVLGLLMDVGNGALLGQHAFAYAVLAFAALSLHRRILWFSLWRQAAHVLVLLLASQFLMLAVRLVAGGVFPGYAYFAASVIAAALWPTATYLLLLPQRRPQGLDENRPI